jgi:hypothetical protein
MWKPFIKDDVELSKKEPYQFFMVRVKGIHPGRGGKFVPTIVQLIEGNLYTSDNELEPIKWVKRNSQYEPTTDPYETDLEWREIPED